MTPSVEHLEEEHHSGKWTRTGHNQGFIFSDSKYTVLQQPQFCSKPWIATYSTMFVVIIACGVLMVSLKYFPKAEMQPAVIHQTDTILVPLQPSSQWLESVSFTTSAGCTGDLYCVPCNDLQPSHNQSYQSLSSVNNADDYIYCLGGSTFTWTWTAPPETVKVSEVEIWLFESYEMATKYDNAGTSQTTFVCSEYELCGLLHNSSGDVLMLKPPTTNALHGQFYFVRKSAVVGTKLVMDRYYYNASLYEEYKIRVVTSASPFVLFFEENFDPTHIGSSGDDCILFNTTKGQGSKHNGSLAVIPTRSSDILFWPGLLGGFLLLLVPCLACTHLRQYSKLQRQYRALHVHS